MVQENNKEPSKTEIIYKALTAYCTEHGGSTPSLRELLDLVNSEPYSLYIQLGTLRYHLDRLEDQERITRDGRGRLRMPKGKWTPE
jgi:hypothetical protein